MKELLFLAGSCMPTGTAYSERIIALSKLFRSCGYHVHIISNFSSDCKYTAGKTYCFDDGIEFQVLVNENNRKSRSAIPTLYKAALEKYVNDHHVDFVLFNSSSRSYYAIVKILNARKIPYALELCEWFDKSSYKLGALDYRYYRMLFFYHFVYTKECAIIGISRYLCNFFREHGVKTLRIPVIMDVEKIPCRTDNNTDKKSIDILFAGNCSKSKESLREMIRAVLEIGEERNDVRLHLFGPNKSELQKNLKKDFALIEKNKNTIIPHGKASHTEVIEALKEADYSFFLRPHRRSSDAGFPTKLVESMSVATPVLTNTTGDIGVYLQNGRNGWMLAENGIAKSLKSAISVDNDTYVKMRKEARDTAERFFDYRVYTDSLNEFLREIIQEQYHNK